MAITTISLFAIIELPVRLIGMCYLSYFTAKLSLERIEKFIAQEEYIQNKVIQIFVMLDLQKSPE